MKWKPPEDGSQKLRFPIFVLYDRLQTVIKNISRIVPYIYIGSTILPVPVWLVIGVEWGSRKRVSKKSVLAFSWVSDTLILARNSFEKSQRPIYMTKHIEQIYGKFGNHSSTKAEEVVCGVWPSVIFCIICV